MKVTRNIDTGDEKQTIRTISTKPKEHFEGRWKSGRLYPLYSVVVNNGTTFISQNAKMKEEPYVIYDAVKKEFKAPDGWLIKEMSADSRVTALGGGGEGGVTPEEVEEMIKDKVDKVDGKGLSTNDYNNTEKNKVASAYQKPNNGIPKSDLAKAVQDVLDDANGAYKKPVTGIPFADLADGVQDSLSNADEAKAGLAGKQDVISDLETIRSGAAAGATSVQPAEFNELKDEVDTIGNGAYEEAWDGNSTPVVADIPAGVVVTYSSASYTGTLAASASTVDKIYLVSDGNGNYDRYTTVEANGAYSWKKVGSTAIPLSNYATKTQVSQLQQEVTADISQLEAKVDGYIEDERVEVPYTNTDIVPWNLASSNYFNYTGSNKGVFLPITPGKRYVIPGGAYQTVGGILKTMPDLSTTTSKAADFATGYSSRSTILPTPDEFEFTAPEDGHYCYMQLKVSSGEVPIHLYEIRSVREGGLSDKVASLENKVEELDAVDEGLQGQIDTISKELFGGRIEYIRIPYNRTDGVTWSLNNNGNFVYSAQNLGVFLPLTPGIQYKVIADDAIPSIIGILNALPDLSTTSSKPASWAEGYNSRVAILAGENYDFTAPEDARWIFLNLHVSAGDVYLYLDKGVASPGLDERVTALEERTPEGTNATLSQLFESMPFAVDSDGWEIPTTPGMVYALKKAAQASQIVYNALANYPSLSSPTGASAGEHTGFPYSSTKEIRKFIGWEVSFRTFMTAVQNLYGMFYTEDISSEHGQSGYGYTYDGANCGPFYGMVCSIFTGWALGFDIPWDTDQLAYLAKINELVRIKEQTPQGVHICDLVWYQGHCVLVTGVRRDQWGNVINVQITESRGAVHSTNFTTAQFETYLHITHDAIIYRPTRVYKNTYEPSEFVAVRGEATPAPFVYNYDICHYAGDYSAMRSDQPTWINYTLGNYTGMKIYKGETLLVTINPDGSLHKVDVSSYMTGAGKYSACLTDGVNDSEATHWQIVDAGCTYEDTGAKQKISFASSNGTPWWVQVCSSRGVAYCWYKPTTEDIANGYCELDLASMISEQYTGTPAATTYVRVMYKADYGGVVSAMVQR